MNDKPIQPDELPPGSPNPLMAELYEHHKRMSNPRKCDPLEQMLDEFHEMQVRILPPQETGLTVWGYLVVALLFLGLVIWTLIMAVTPEYAFEEPDWHNQPVIISHWPEEDVVYDDTYMQPYIPDDAVRCVITCYGLPTFGEFAVTARGDSIRETYEMAMLYELDGICAVSESTPWYDRIRDDFPPILHVEGYGDYLAVDRMGVVHNGVDIWVPYRPGVDGPQWCEWRAVWEIQSFEDGEDEPN